MLFRASVPPEVLVAVRLHRFHETGGEIAQQAAKLDSLQQFIDMLNRLVADLLSDMSIDRGLEYFGDEFWKSFRRPFVFHDFADSEKCRLLQLLQVVEVTGSKDLHMRD